MHLLMLTLVEGTRLDCICRQIEYYEHNIILRQCDYEDEVNRVVLWIKCFAFVDPHIDHILYLKRTILPIYPPPEVSLHRLFPP